MDKTLHITDLDGTLLGSNQEVSAFTANAINALVCRGMAFSYATARSIHTAAKVTRTITASLPAIVYNGAFIVDHRSGKPLLSNYFSPGDVQAIHAALAAAQLQPIVYAHSGSAETFSFLQGQMSAGAEEFLSTRRGDPRSNPVECADALYAGQVFYFTCIDDAAKLYPVYERLRRDFSCVYQKDTYSDHQWLEILPQNANKATAAQKLKELLGCRKIISFGDGKNDLPLFLISDECYAVSNADPALKAAATGVLGTNDDDSVAKWLLKNATF